MDKTPEQLINIYNESRRQKAQDNLNQLFVISLLKTSEKNRENEIRNLELEAHPYDTELDDVFGKEDMGRLKQILKEKEVI